MSWRVVVWRCDRRGVWTEWSTYPGDRVGDALEEARSLNVSNSELFAVFAAGEVPKS